MSKNPNTIIALAEIKGKRERRIADAKLEYLLKESQIEIEAESESAQVRLLACDDVSEREKIEQEFSRRTNEIWAKYRLELEKVTTELSSNCNRILERMEKELYS